MNFLHSFRLAACACLVGSLALGCASLPGGAGSSTPPRTTCAIVGGVIGAIAGGVIAHNTSESETDEELTGAGLGAATGALIGYLICGEGQPAPNQPPTARIRATPTTGSAPLEVAFAAQAEDPDGRITDYRWDFGDGSSATGARVGHTYAGAGSYTVRLTVTDDRGLSASAESSIEVSAASAQEVPPAEEPPAATRRRIVLRGINFGFDSAQIAPEDGLILDIAAEQLAAAPEVRVRVIGHTDATGGEAYNQQLSQRRAQAVVDYLTSKGIAGDRLRAVGQGESEPVASNDTRDGRRQNRRVALELIE